MASALAALLVSALSVSGAIFLILELDRSFEGTLQVSSTPLRAALGDLSIRMRRALMSCPRGPVVLVGGDIPAFAAPHVAAAFRLLGCCHLVFGPAEDGGFWLVGARSPRHMPPLFDQVRWSSQYALADSLTGLPRRVKVGFVDRLEDVDDEDSYRRLSPRRGF